MDSAEGNYLPLCGGGGGGGGVDICMAMFAKSTGMFAAPPIFIGLCGLGIGLGAGLGAGLGLAILMPPAAIANDANMAKIQNVIKSFILLSSSRKYDFIVRIVFRQNQIQIIVQIKIYLHLYSKIDAVCEAFH